MLFGVGDSDYGQRSWDVGDWAVEAWNLVPNGFVPANGLQSLGSL